MDGYGIDGFSWGPNSTDIAEETARADEAADREVNRGPEAVITPADTALNITEVVQSRFGFGGLNFSSFLGGYRGVMPMSLIGLGGSRPPVSFSAMMTPSTRVRVADAVVEAVNKMGQVPEKDSGIDPRYRGITMGKNLFWISPDKINLLAQLAAPQLIELAKKEAAKKQSLTPIANEESSVSSQSSPRSNPFIRLLLPTVMKSNAWKDAMRTILSPMMNPAPATSVGGTKVEALDEIDSKDDERLDNEVGNFAERFMKRVFSSINADATPEEVKSPADVVTSDADATPVEVKPPAGFEEDEVDGFEADETFGEKKTTPPAAKDPKVAVPTPPATAEKPPVDVSAPHFGPKRKDGKYTPPTAPTTDPKGKDEKRPERKDERVADVKNPKVGEIAQMSTWKIFSTRFIWIQKDDHLAVKVSKLFSIALACLFFPITGSAMLLLHFYDRCVAKQINTKAGTKVVSKGAGTVKA